ncbi:hypothetical protein NP233_g1315 [Leucocoprinus birnbaumii]|uniref:F-box domain-containing protein n=1 Tax=Leucocoprinus birnbaumii TaxID=56174 RepID=A0AAD5YZN1_9AGAR|nr:hypothetical protein NP233_g1315 [Leucocoprinus birnbaumii]
MNSASVPRKLGPVHQLPPEILEEIFNLCTPPFAEVSCNTPPLLLCLVCTSWRDIVLHSSRLWNRVAIDLTNFVPEVPTGSKKSASPVVTFLERSKQQPLAIQLTASLDALDHHDWKAQFDSVLDRVHGRIRELNLSSPWLNKLLYAFNSGVRFPQLESLTVTSTGEPSFESLPIPINAFSQSTFLRRLHYNAYISQETALNLAVPWSQLTHVTLADTDYASWRYIFARCTNMRFGSFVISGPPPTSPKPFSDINFPYLTHLAIHNLQSSRSPLILEGCSFPNLKELTLEWMHSPGFNVGFLSTIKRLQKLAISSAYSINVAEVISIFSLTPLISHLQMLSDHCSREVFEVLTYHVHQQRPLLPYLRILEIQTPHSNTVHYEEEALNALKKALGSRWWIFPQSKVKRLQTLRMSTSGYDPSSIREALHHLTKAGLDLQVYPVASATAERQRLFRK